MNKIDKKFFQHQTDSSRIKAYIVSEYFPEYCKIIRLKHEPEMFRYIDLFAGPGIYEDGNESTPMLVARNVCQDESLRNKVQFIFNDMNFADTLKENFENEFPSGTFGKKVYFLDREVGKCEKVYDFLAKNEMVTGKNEKPSLLFFDPFGYKGMRTEVLAKFLNNWGNEIFIFINTKRINPALENAALEDLMKLWFPHNYQSLKSRIRIIPSVPERLEFIIDNIGREFQSFMNHGKLYYLAFRFQEEDSKATSHYILHLTKHPRGYDLVKSVYKRFSNEDIVLDGCNTYTFDAKKSSEHPSLFGNSEEAIDDLKFKLYQRYKGESMSARAIFEEHQKMSRYARSHYLAALRKLVKENLVVSKFLDGKKHKVTVLLIDQCVLTFK